MIAAGEFTTGPFNVDLPPQLSLTRMLCGKEDSWYFQSLDN
jgi:hypothetical protein